MDAGEVRHWNADVNGVSIHVAERGPEDGPVVLLLHGFPELWLSWRHQMAALAARKFRSLAPDLRGYGDSSAPSDPAAYSIFHIVGDVVALLDHLQLTKVFVVGHDLGAQVAWHLCLFRPDRVRAAVVLGVPYFARHARPITEAFAAFGDGFYINQFQEPGRAESAFARYDVATVLKKFYSIQIDDLSAPPGVEIIDFLEASPSPLPWISEEELGQYAEKFQKSGFTGPLNYYRMVETNWRLLAPWNEAKITVPVKFIAGDKDTGVQSFGTEKYIKSGAFKSIVPNLEVTIIEGHHFLQQEQAERVNSEIISYLVKVARQAEQQSMEAEATAEVRHWTADVNGISLHVAERGPADGPAVLLIHGFPELWFSWRHQMAALATRGFRALAPDLRGYGDSSVPTDPAAYSILHIVGDLVALLDHLRLSKVFVVGHDWGAQVAWHLCLFRPDRVHAAVVLGIPYFPRGPRPMTDSFAALGDGFYINQFQEPGRAERAFAHYDVATVLKKFYALEIDELIAPPGVEIIDFLQAPLSPIPWMTEEELGQYAEKFQKTGFTGPLNYYRMLETNWRLTAPWSGSKIIVPAKFILSKNDVGLQSFRTEKYVKSGALKENVPDLEVSIIEGHHFVQQEEAESVNSEILSFLDKFPSEGGSA